METKTKLLFVDDEPNIRLTLPPILEMHGFTVTVAATVAEALTLINNRKFDVLLSDLNIGHPGDGFVVVSAMRQIQPTAVTIIITGYPAFETALEAIRNQVDDYITKPAEVPRLVETIMQKVMNRPARRSIALKRIPALLHENREIILKRWLADVMASPEMGAIHLSQRAWSAEFPRILKVATEASESHRIELTERARTYAFEHGELRREQGFSAPMLAEEVRVLLRVIGVVVQDNLLSVDLSQVIPDLFAVADFLDGMLRESLRALSGLSETQTV